MLNRGKKFLLSLFLSVFLLVSFITPYAHAQENTWYDQPFMGPEGFYRKVNDSNNPTEIFGERYTTAQVQWVVYGFVAFFINRAIPKGREIFSCINKDEEGFTGAISDIVDCLDLIVYEASPQQEMYADKDVNTEKELTRSFVNNPISSIAYLNGVKQRLHLVKEAEAQTGYGFTAAEPVIQIWRAVRNLTYFLMVLVVIAMAFMIMFRMKLPSQVVITVQSALPKVVVTLILITFSYAIAGFVIDLMYVSLGLIAGIIIQSGISNAGFTDVFNDFNGNNLSILFMWGAYNTQFALALINGIIMGGVGTFFIGTLLSVVILPLSMIVILITFFRILWMLMKTYFTILLLIIIGPIQILMGAITGGGFGRWLRNLVAHVSVYPVTGVLFFLAFLFLKASMSGAQGGDTIWEAFIRLWDIITPGDQTPFDIDNALISNAATWSAPYTWGEAALELTWLGVSFVCLSMIPKAADITKSFLLGGRFEMGSAIGEALGPVSNPARRAWGATTGAAGSAVGGAISDRVGFAISRRLGTQRETTKKEVGRQINMQSNARGDKDNIPR